jgi:hypothetical protein
VATAIAITTITASSARPNFQVTAQISTTPFPRLNLAPWEMSRALPRDAGRPRSGGRPPGPHQAT